MRRFITSLVLAFSLLAVVTTVNGQCVVTNTLYPSDYYPSGTNGETWNYFDAGQPGNAFQGSIAYAIFNANQGNCPTGITFQTGLTGNINVPGGGARPIPIHSNSGVVIDGAGATVTFSGGQWNSIFEIKDATGWTLKNVAIASATLNGIHIENSTSITIDSVDVQNTVEHGINVVNSNLVTIRGSYLHENGTGQDRSAGTWAGVDGYQTFPGGEQITVAGIRLQGTRNYIIDDNTISGNHGHGIHVDNQNNNTVENATIRSNRIGMSVDGTIVEGNFGEGILISNGRSITIGGDIDTDANLISGNGNRTVFTGGDPTGLSASQAAAIGAQTANMHGHGIELRASRSVTVIGNLIGTDATGNGNLDALGNGTGNNLNGIYIKGFGGTNSTQNIIGSTILSGRNVVSGNGFAFDDVNTSDSNPSLPDSDPSKWLFGVRHGIQIHDDGAQTTANQVMGNYVGYGKDGVTSVPNSEDGISMLGFGSGSSGNIIGGPTAAHGNLIGGSNFGIAFQGPGSANNTILNNFIGASDANGSNPNPLRAAGIKMQNGANGNTIGGVGTGNTVVGTTGPGIEILSSGSVRNRILGNILSCNTMGIDLRSAGNLEYASPQINLADNTANTVSGFSAASGDIIDVYLKDNCGTQCAVNAQGFTYVGQITSSADAQFGTGGGYWTLDLTTLGLTEAERDSVVFTSTDGSGNTSEFSTCTTATLCTSPPQALITSTTLDYCENGTLVLDANQLTGENYTYTWFRGATQVNTGTELFSITVDQPGAYTVEIANPVDPLVCVLTSAPITVTENPNPVAPTITGDDPVCFGGTGAYSIPATPAYASYTWGVSATGASVIGTGNSVSVNFGTAPASTYNVTLTVIDNNGCTSPEATLPVTVTALPQITAINGPTEACENETGVGPFTVTTVPASIPGAVYNWSATGGVSLLTPTAASTNADVTLAGAKTISVGITNDGNGCATAADFDVALTVNELPNVSAISGADAVCENTTGETYTVNSTVTGSTFDWLVTGATIDAPSTSNSIDISFTNTSADIQVTATANGCTGTASAVKTVTINALPITNAIVASDDSICLDQGSVTFSVAPGTAGSDYQWTVSDANAVVIGQGTETITVDFSASTPGIINILVSETSAALCASLVDPTLDVELFDFPSVTGGITTSSSSPVCNETGVTYSVNAGVTPLNWVFNWTVPAGATIVSGDGTASIVVDLGDQNGQIEVVAVNEAGCETIVTPLPVSLSGCNLQANFAVVDSICFGQTITVTDLTSGDNVDSLVWNFGINATPQTATSFAQGSTVDVTFSTIGNQQITLTAYDGLASSVFVDSVMINELPTTDTKLIVAPTSVCPNSDSVLVSLQGNYDPAITYAWSVSSGATLISNPDSSDIYLNFTNISPVTVSVTETTQSGCNATSPSADITLFAEPDPIVIQGDPNACEDVVQNFTLTGGSGGTIIWGIIPDTVATAGVVGSGTSISVTFDNASPLQDIEITATETSANGCTSTASNASFFVTIRPKPVVLSVEGDTTVCAYGGTGNYNATGTDVDHFIWTIPSGATVATSNADSSNISLDFGVNNFSIIVASAVSDFGCLSDAPAILQVTGEDIRPFDLLIGPNSCAEVTNILSITPEDSNATYDWQLVGGGVIIQGNTTDSIEVLNPAADYEVTIVAERKDIPGCQLTVGPRAISINELLDQIDLSVDYDFTPNVICDNDDERFDSLRTIASNVTIGDNNPLLTYEWTYNYAPSIVDSVLNVSSITDTLTGFNFGRNSGLHSFTVKVNNEKCVDSLEATIIVNVVESKPVDYNITSILSCIGDVDTVGIRNAHIATGHDDDVIYTWLHQGDSLITEIVQKTEPDGQGGTVINDYVEIVQWDTVGAPNFFGRDSIFFVHYDTNFVGTNSGNEIFYDNYSFTGEFDDQLIVNADPQYCIIYDRNDVTKGENLLRDTLNPEVVSRPGAELGVYDLQTFEYSGTVTPFDVDDFELSLDNPFSIEKVQDDFALEEIFNRDVALGYVYPTGQTDVSYEWSWFLDADDSIFTDNIVTTNDFPYLVRPRVVGAPNEVSYMVKTSNGVCYDSAIVVININYVPWPPNAFSPNGDGSFDTWEIFNVEKYEGTTVTIFNRWGTELLKIEDYHLEENWWDGTKEGNDLPTGTYFYLIDFNDGSEEVTGAVSIVK